MQAFIKDSKTFETTSINLVLDYELKYSIYDTVSSVTIPTPANLPQVGDIIYLDGNGFFGVIKNVSLDYGKTELDVNQIMTLLGRDMFYQSSTFTYLEDYIVELITDNYTNCSDSFYALPYLTATAVTHTSSQMLPDLENNIYSVKSYASKMRRLYNIFCTWGISRTQLTLTVAQQIKTVKNVDFSNPNYVLTEQDFSTKSVSKITTFCEENSQTQTWILLNDGSIVNTLQTTDRVNGEWVPLVVQTAAEVNDAVKDEFAKNEYSHKIEFQAPKSTGFNLYDKLNIKLNNSIFSSYVSSVTYKKNSDIIDVQCGELQMQYPFLNLL